MSLPGYPGLDFMALQTLCLVHEKRSFTEAALALDVNQSAVSYTIKKLRRIFGDPLFFRQGTRVAATERCSAIVAEAAAMLRAVDRLTAPDTFDAATAQRGFVIACNYYERVVILPHLVRHIRRVAPGIRLDTIPSTATGDDQLRAAEADILIGPLRPDEADFYCRTLLDEHYVCLMDPGNPLAGADLTLEDFLSCDHARVNYGDTWQSPYLRELERRGLRPNNVLSVSSPAGLEDMVAGTSLVATVPGRVAARIGRGLHLTPCPVPAPFQIDLVWTTRTHASAAHRWLRDCVSALAPDLR